MSSPSITATQPALLVSRRQAPKRKYDASLAESIVSALEAAGGWLPRRLVAALPAVAQSFDMDPLEICRLAEMHLELERVQIAEENARARIDLVIQRAEEYASPEMGSDAIVRLTPRERAKVHTGSSLPNRPLRSAVRRYLHNHPDITLTGILRTRGMDFTHINRALGEAPMCGTDRNAQIMAVVLVEQVLDMIGVTAADLWPDLNP